jgi:hypothetical protein
MNLFRDGVVLKRGLFSMGSLMAVNPVRLMWAILEREMEQQEIRVLTGESVLECRKQVDQVHRC